MAFTVTAGDAVLHTVTDFIPIRGSAEMDTGTIAEKGETISGDEPVPE
jgi:hypothetical protein